MTGAIIVAPRILQHELVGSDAAWTCATLVYGMSAELKLGPGTARISFHEAV